MLPAFARWPLAEGATRLSLRWGGKEAVLPRVEQLWVGGTHRMGGSQAPFAPQIGLCMPALHLLPRDSCQWGDCLCANAWAGHGTRLVDLNYSLCNGPRVQPKSMDVFVLMPRPRSCSQRRGALRQAVPGGRICRWPA